MQIFVKTLTGRTMTV